MLDYTVSSLYFFLSFQPCSWLYSIWNLDTVLMYPRVLCRCTAHAYWHHRSSGPSLHELRLGECIYSTAGSLSLFFCTNVYFKRSVHYSCRCVGQIIRWSTLHPSFSPHVYSWCHSSYLPWSGKRSPRQRRLRPRRTTSIERVSVGQYYCAIYTAELHDSWRYRQCLPAADVVQSRYKNIPLLDSSDPMSNICSTDDILPVKMAEQNASTV